MKTEVQELKELIEQVKVQVDELERRFKHFAAMERLQIMADYADELSIYQGDEVSVYQGDVTFNNYSTQACDVKENH